MNTWQERWLDRWYRERPDWSNGTEEFHNLCATNIPRGSTILEVGAGPTNKTSAFLASIGPTDGLDVDPDVKTNRDLRATHVLTGSRYPFDDATFDAAVSNYVAEHITDPVAHLREVFRVLRPKGVYIVRTPNLYHYVALVSAVTPHWFHVLVANRLRRLPPDNHDPYPTCYRMNTEGALRRLAREAGFAVRSLDMVEKEPSYALASRVLFAAGLAYERTVNSHPHLGRFRSNIFAVLEKPQAS